MEVRVRSYGQNRYINPQKQKTKIKMKDAKKVQSDLLHDLPDWLQEFREKLVGERNPSEPQGNPELGNRDTSSSSRELPKESRAKVEPGSGKHSVYTHFPKDPNCDICLKTKKKNEGFLQEACWYSRAQSGTFWWLENCRSQNSQKKKVNHVTIIDTLWWYKIW